MSSRDATLITRRAIWEAHNKQCFYCSAPIRFCELEVEHVVPESITSKPAEVRAELARTHGINESYDVHEIENLVASCRTCNGRKRDDLPAPPQLALLQTVARRLAVRVRELIKKYSTDDAREKERVALALAFERGDLSPADVAQAVALKRAAGGTVVLASEMHLFGGLPLRELDATMFDAYLAAPVEVGGHKVRVRMFKGEGEELVVASPAEYQSAAARGFSVRTNSDYKLSARYFVMPSELVNVLRRARVAERSCMSDPKRGLCDIALLPATLLFCAADMADDPGFAHQREMLKDRSIADLVADGAARVVDVGSDLLVVTFASCRTFMMELLRADVDADGVEDLVLQWGGGPVDGTYATGALRIITRGADDEMFREVVPRD